MNNLQRRWGIAAGVFLLVSTTQQAGAQATLAEEFDEEITNDMRLSAAYLEGPNILEVMIQDGEQVTPPTPVNGSYLAGLVVHQRIQANWLESEIGLQLFHDGEKLDPRRYQVEWKIVTSPYSVVKARLAESSNLDFGQRIQIETPLNSLNGRLIAAIEIEARIFDREQPDKAPFVVVQTLRELLANGRDGL